MLEITNNASAIPNILHSPPLTDKAPDDRRVDNAIQWINLYLADRTVSFVNTYWLASNISV